MAEYAQPPYTSLFEWIDEGITITLNFGNYLFLLSDSLYATAYLNSIRIAAISTIITLLIGIQWRTALPVPVARSEVYF